MLKLQTIILFFLSFNCWSQSVLQPDQQLLYLHEANYEGYRDSLDALSDFNKVDRWDKLKGVAFVDHVLAEHNYYRFKILNNADINREMWVYADLHWEFVSVYVNGKKVGVMGKTVKSSQKTINDNFQIVPIHLAAKQEAVVVFDVKSRLNYGTKILLMSPTYFLTNVLLLEKNISFFYGVIAILFLFNLIWYFLTKEKLRLAYSFYIFSIAFFAGKADNYLFHALLPEYTAFVFYEYYLDKLVLAWGVGVFLYTYHSKEELNKLSQKIIVVALSIYTVQYFFELLIGTSYYYHTLIALVWVYFISFLFSPRGVKKEYLMMIAVFFMCTGISISVLQSINWRFFTNTFTIFAADYSFIIDALFFAIITAKKARDSSKEKIYLQEEVIAKMKENEFLQTKVTRELEEKVQERTRDLNAKNSELIILNEELKVQSELIMKMNEQLDLKNYHLKRDNKDILKSRITGVPISMEEIKTVFINKESCLQYLHSLKWSNGFSCSKCFNKTHKEISSWGGKRCSKCGTIETVTAKTLFERLRIPLEKAFYIAYVAYNHKKALKPAELSVKLEIPLKTCYNFVNKCKLKIEGETPQSFDDFLIN